MSDAEWWAPIRQKQQQHFAMLGMFHGAWAAAEGRLYDVLLHYCGVNEDVGRSIFAGPRVKAMADVLKRLMVNIPIERIRADDLNFLLGQLAAIQDIRDKVTHHGDLGFHMAGEGELADGYTFIDNAGRPGRKTGEYLFIITTKQFENGITDLFRIISALGRHFDSDFSPWEGSGEHGTWLCKPLSPRGHPDGFRVVPQFWRRPPKP